MYGCDVSEGDAPTLTAGGSSSVTLRWLVPRETHVEEIRAEWRPAGWLLPGAWRQLQLQPEDVQLGEPQEEAQRRDL